MKLACIFLVSATVWLAFVEGSQYRSDYEYNKEAGGWLKFHRVPATFTDAYLRCNAEGSSVASPLTVDLQHAMMTLAKNNSGSCGIFTGVHAVFSKGDFATVEGVPLYKLPVTWAPDEPDNHDNSEDCTIMLQNGTLADVRCNDTYPYICYKKWTEAPITSPCGTVDREYALDTRTGSCYKFHYVGRSWRRAYMTCIAEGGYLAIINGPTEVKVIKDVFAKYPSDKIVSSFKNVASIGFYSWGEHGNWYTIHGDSLVKAGHSTFASSQPDNNKDHNKEGSFCGGVFRTGLLDDLWCEGISIPFICEKNPDSLMFNNA